MNNSHDCYSSLTKGEIIDTGNDFVTIRFHDDRGIQNIKIITLYDWIVFKGGIDHYDPETETLTEGNYVIDEPWRINEKYYILSHNNSSIDQIFIDANRKIVIEVRDQEDFDPFTTLIINVNGNCEKNFRTLVTVNQDLLMRYHQERLTPEIGMNKPLVLDRELIELLVANKIIEPAPTVSKVRMNGGILTEY